MSKRIVELTCGDPKTNQQTASKVECVINVNNNQRGASAPISVTDDGYADECVIEVKEETKDTKDVKKTIKKSVKDVPVSSVSSLFVRREIAQEERDTPLAAEGYIQTASRPTITESEIVSSISVKDTLLKAFANLLTTNDAALMTQLNAARKYDERRVVLILDDLKALITAIIKLVDPEFEEKDVRIKTYVNDFEVGCCGATKKHTFVNPFNEISSICVGNQDLKIHQFEAYNTIEEKLGVSLAHVYSNIADKVMNDALNETAV